MVSQLPMLTLRGAKFVGVAQRTLTAAARTGILRHSVGQVAPETAVSKRPIEVTTWVYTPPVARPNIAARRPALFSPRLGWWLRRGVVAAVCIALYELLFTAVIWSAGAPQPPSREFLPIVRVDSDSSDDAMQWITLDPNALTDPAKQKSVPPPVHLQSFDTRKERLKVAALVSDVPLPHTPDATVADAGRLSQMFGRYMGQINARIERAWLRPRSPIGAPSFSCQVQIKQDEQGAVTEVMLVRCNGDPRWQLSLVQAIESASPLPAPPDPDVFTRIVHLRFSAEPFTSQSAGEGYEPEAVAQVAEVASATRTAQDVLTHTFADPHAHGIIHLNITGTQESTQTQETIPETGTR